MEKNIENIKAEALAELQDALDPDGVKSISVRYLGRKGIITRYLRNISNLPAAERPFAGKRANEVKNELDAAFKDALGKLASDARGTDERIDVSLPGRTPPRGFLHPLTQITRDICDIFTRMGFNIAEGPEVESDYYNFEALNIPKNHPARDMQDTFYVSDAIVLRTQTSPMQVRTMEKQKPPVRIISPGKVYRCDSDLTHTPMFSQVEGLLVDENVSFGDLKGTLTAFVHQMFDAKTALRFRPSFFPFTEPSAEVDILCVMCRGKGCRVCSQTGWLEVLGSGMVHPAVFENVGYDTRRYSGFAFGMGVERIAMLKYGIDDLRKFFDNDFRFLRQF
ncbi:phenylalanine--tRNA ligase subunit alpha [Desulfococcus sp.]|uniref:Phenylalanine--tRNA ligase alpha subunit n=1 Tax=Desulfococcus multivorans DSM 2059 TaxID=1121405 RepID=S7VDR8_DESML|nr:phenylalanine--tRNA ligase subunit alpha [Desulfococcus multivorans]AOY60631.1 PheS: Phenylalanyl-tRNA synthetase, alpha chain [Desulfococcus multivorans]AQV03142.1 phenylalanine--tRNA ligase subunit alpha [Desulfococcus multivorans]EPR44849.1 Phenylalanyl-tRNA synthetase alpha chain [Desulfococcus multivorans DSM 2059]SKA03399.1 phenylalanyl-tRNA synthetase, alpha subunit [Desulfococcus multivorans DSM 2059]